MAGNSDNSVGKTWPDLIDQWARRLSQGGPWAAVLVGLAIVITTGLTATLVGQGFFGGDPEEQEVAHPHHLLMVGVALIIIGLMWRWIMARRSSRLAEPAELRTLCERFVGREQDTKRLLEEIRRSPLVWLVGESGAGKSWLLRKAVVPELDQDSKFFPIYVDQWGENWEQSPEALLYGKIPRDILSDTGGSLEHILTESSNRLGRTAVILFDQFDDYVTQHRKKFVPAAGGSVLPPENLRRTNVFWDMIARLLNEKKIRCVFATRVDMQWGLASVRFERESVYLLPRLGPEVPRELLLSLQKSGAIEEPDHGWTALRDRICEDLASEKLVLPIQMRVVLQSLRTLTYLTLRSYQAKGGLIGLEASHIGDQVKGAATLSGWKPETVMSLLLELVDRESGKTVARTEHRFAGIGGRNAAGLKKTLEHLKRTDILRDRVREDDSSRVWQLDHDYLVRGVLETHRRQSWWQQQLDDAARRYASASGFRARWRALLSPLEQMRIAYERLRGRLRFAGHRGYAFLSTARLLGNMWVALAILGTYIGGELWIQRETRRLFASIGVERRITQGEMRALWEITARSRILRLAIIREALAEPVSAQQFGRRENQVIVAVVGTMDSMRRKILDEVVKDSCYESDSNSELQLAACYELVSALETNFPIAVEYAIRSIGETTSSRQRSQWVHMLETVEPQLTSEELARIFEVTIKKALASESDTKLRQFSSILQIFGERIDPTQAEIFVCRFS